MIRLAGAGEISYNPKNKDYQRTYHRLWFWKDIPIEMIETSGTVSGEFQVLTLVLSYRDMSRPVD
jgi:hypothetical protein